MTPIRFDNRPSLRIALVALAALASACAGERDKAEERAAASVQATMEEPPQLTLEEVRAKYERAQSRYVNVDGVDIHYLDEGEGPVVIMLHASYLGAISWDATAAALQDDYRVIRVDFPNNGLSGSETKEPPAERWNLLERNVEIIDQFTQELGVEKHHLIATSSGGSVGFRYASYFPDRVERFVLVNSAGMPRTAATNPNRNREDEKKWADMKVKPADYWAHMLGRNMPTRNAPSWMVDMAYDFNRRRLDTPLSAYVFHPGDPKSILAGITAPTLIAWGLENSTVMHLEADVMQHWMTGAPTVMRKYENTGHYPYIESPERINADILAFLSGEMDDELRQTRRAPVDRIGN